MAIDDLKKIVKELKNFDKAQHLFKIVTDEPAFCSQSVQICFIK